jgi:2-keto-4-pentenoate hydratase/2-oxohepta-3-ene-1,7-dioic acid hydratase in catechol pathway
LKRENFIRFAWQAGIYWGTHEGEQVRRWNGPPYSGGRPTDRLHPVAEVRLLPPVAPSKIIAVGLNYAPHVKESASATEIPKEPVIFMKPPTALLAPGAAIILPRGVDRVDYEGELGVVVGTGGRSIPEERALEHVWGWTIVNDVTARNLQKIDKQWTRAKGFDTFCPVGPWVTNGIDTSAATLTTRLNGEVRQQSAIDQMIFPVARLIAFISRVMTLCEGDLISTGTPSGVGPLAEGDKIEIEIEGIGTLTNLVAVEV